ncbi:hypothetical protein PsorP6_009995 [Peronosclerospora sorghi]|uniref:Uncharacterized protein n=1 Tax=Peronosclerospora sorghi TaxID=230839 RepID=A0ACC0VXF1_9STRA|nr:hypothetical protein PsorP6_009995 [Peronosclerospora sorghi]
MPYACGGTRCLVDGCMKYVVSEGLCLGHGGGRQCRGSPRCSSNAVSRGLCAQHGGGRKYSEENCNKHVASGGLFRTHGGRRLAKCQTALVVLKVEVYVMCMAAEGVVNVKVADPVPKKAVSVSRTAEMVVVK